MIYLPSPRATNESGTSVEESAGALLVELVSCLLFLPQPAHG